MPRLQVTRVENPVNKELETEILSKIAEVIEEVAGIDPAVITPDKSLIDDLDLDSLDLVEIAVRVEDKYGVKVPDEDLARLRKIGDIVSYICKLEEENPEAFQSLRDRFSS